MQPAQTASGQPEHVPDISVQRRVAVHRLRCGFVSFVQLFEIVRAVVRVPTALTHANFV